MSLLKGKPLKSRLLPLLAAAQAALLAAACGFTPVNAPGGSGSPVYGQVLVQAPELVNTVNDTDAYLLVRGLEQRLGRGGGGTYRLDLSLRVRNEGQAITREGNITRYSIVGRAEFALVRAADGVVVASGTEDNFTGYSATGSTVETLAGERDAHRRLMDILAAQIANRLLAAPGLAAPA